MSPVPQNTCRTCSAPFTPSTMSSVYCKDCCRKMLEGKMETRSPEVPPALTEEEQLVQAMVVADNPFNKPESCRTCGLFREPGPVPSVGPRDAKMVFIGEAPGAEEVDDPRNRPARFAPFIGGSGRLLTALCVHAGIYRKDVFIANSVRCRPPGNRTPTKSERDHCKHFLVEELEEIRPNVAVALGELGFVAATGKEGEKIGNWRGVPVEGILLKDPADRTHSGESGDAGGDPGTPAGRLLKVFGSWHPAFIARQQYNWPFAVHDLVRALAESAFPEVRRVPYEIVRNPSPTDDGGRVLADARARGAFTFDFETSGLSPERDQIIMCGVVARPDQANVFTWSPGSRAVLQAALDDPGIEIVGQNILFFDLPFYEAKGGDVSKAWLKVFDTMVTFHLANASYGQTPVKEQTSFQKPGQHRQKGMDKDLTMIASCHTDIPYWKSRDNYRNDLRGVCGVDCIATDRAALDPHKGIKAELKAYDMLDLYYKHVLPVHPVIHKMTKRGVNIDQGRAASWSILLEEQAGILEETLKQGLGQPNLNLGSPQQLMKLLYEDMGLPVQYIHDKKKGTTRPTANAEALETLAMMYPEHAVLATLVDIRNLKKMKSTFIDPALMAGRVHPKFSGSKTATGRFNSWDPNAQNVPEEMRDIWIADDDDCVVMAADWSQIEWRLAMVLSGDPTGLALLASGRDNHKAVASEAFGIPYDEVDDPTRHMAKFIVYGLGYGRGADSIARGHNLPIAKVQEFMRGFMQRFSTFFRWREENVNFVKKNHYLANPFKRRRWWYTYEVTEVYNMPQQSTAADMMYEALIDLDRELPKESTLRLTVHDEAVLNVPKDIVKETWKCVEAVMQRTFEQIVDASRDPAMVRKYYPNGWFCPVDIHIGKNWRMAKSKDKATKRERDELERYLGVGGH